MNEEVDLEPRKPPKSKKGIFRPRNMVVALVMATCAMLYQDYRSTRRIIQDCYDEYRYSRCIYSFTEQQLGDSAVNRSKIRIIRRLENQGISYHNPLMGYSGTLAYLLSNPKDFQKESSSRFRDMSLDEGLLQIQENWVAHGPIGDEIPVRLDLFEFSDFYQRADNLDLDFEAYLNLLPNSSNKEALKEFFNDRADRKYEFIEGRFKEKDPVAKHEEWKKRELIFFLFSLDEVYYDVRCKGGNSDVINLIAQDYIFCNTVPYHDSGESFHLYKHKTLPIELTVVANGDRVQMFSNGDFGLDINSESLALATRIANNTSILEMRMEPNAFLELSYRGN